MPLKDFLSETLHRWPFRVFRPMQTLRNRYHGVLHPLVECSFGRKIPVTQKGASQKDPSQAMIYQVIAICTPLGSQINTVIAVVGSSCMKRRSPSMLESHAYTVPHCMIVLICWSRSNELKRPCRTQTREMLLSATGRTQTKTTESKADKCT